ncbi:MAG: hypothetical protein FWC27_15630 [Firmicutes bacterium]|nr:hypothetical protein [Bacillota bacterium]
MKDKLLKLLKRLRRTPKPPKLIRFIDTDGNTLFLLPDGGSIVIAKSDGEQVVEVCRYVTDDLAEFDGTERYLSAFAEECQRTGAVFAPEAAPEYYENYRIIRKMPVPGNVIALGRDLNHYWRYVTLECSQVRDSYDYPNYHTEGWRANRGYEYRVQEWQRGKAPRPVVLHTLRERGDCE